MYQGFSLVLHLSGAEPTHRIGVTANAIPIAALAALGCKDIHLIRAEANSRRADANSRDNYRLVHQIHHRMIVSYGADSQAQIMEKIQVSVCGVRHI
jgi:hypothetical protein